MWATVWLGVRICGVCKLKSAIPNLPQLLCKNATWEREGLFKLQCLPATKMVKHTHKKQSLAILYLKWKRGEKLQKVLRQRVNCIRIFEMIKTLMCWRAGASAGGYGVTILFWRAKVLTKCCCEVKEAFFMKFTLVHDLNLMTFKFNNDIAG